MADPYDIFRRACPELSPECWLAATRWVEEGGDLLDWLCRFGLTTWVSPASAEKLRAAVPACTRSACP